MAGPYLANRPAYTHDDDVFDRLWAGIQSLGGQIGDEWKQLGDLPPTPLEKRLKNAGSRIAGRFGELNTPIGPNLPDETVAWLDKKVGPAATNVIGSGAGLLELPGRAVTSAIRWADALPRLAGAGISGLLDDPDHPSSEPSSIEREINMATDASGAFVPEMGMLSLTRLPEIKLPELPPERAPAGVTVAAAKRPAGGVRPPIPEGHDMVREDALLQKAQQLRTLIAARAQVVGPRLRDADRQILDWDAQARALERAAFSGEPVSTPSARRKQGAQAYENLIRQRLEAQAAENRFRLAPSQGEIPSLSHLAEPEPAPLSLLDEPAPPTPSAPVVLKKPLGYDPAKMAVQYPDVGPPVPAIDKNTGRPFEQKQLTPEAQAVQLVRQDATKQIKAGRYDPYYPVEERAHVNPRGYPAIGDTMAEAIPAKQATIDKYLAIYDTPEARKRLLDAYDAGKEDPLAHDWYAMKQLEADYIAELGLKDGRKAFKKYFADAMATTTGGADPTSNLMMAHYGGLLDERGLPLPDQPHQYPFPIGGRFAGTNMPLWGKEMTAGAHPKRHNFSANFLGYRDPMTLDEQMSSVWDRTQPVPGTYGVAEQVAQDVAAKAGVGKGSSFQDVAWKGLKGVPGKPMIQHINEAIYRTSRVTGLSPEEVVRQSIIRRKGPIYTFLLTAGLGGGGLLADQGEQ